MNLKINTVIKSNSSYLIFRCKLSTKKLFLNDVCSRTDKFPAKLCMIFCSNLYRQIGRFYRGQKLRNLRHYNTTLSRKRRKKETIKSVCRSVAAERNMAPYVPMTNEQHNALSLLYWGEIWREISWKSPVSTMELMERVVLLQHTFPSAVTPLIKVLMMSQGVSETTLDRVINIMQGKGLTTTQEVKSIGRISMLLMLCINSR